jgi:hypothetical protein
MHFLWYILFALIAWLVIGFAIGRYLRSQFSIGLKQKKIVQKS